MRTLVLHIPWLPTSDQSEDGVPLLGRGLLFFPQPLVRMAEAGGEQLFELLQRLGLLPRGCHDRQKHPRVGLNRIPQATAAVQALLELADHAGHPAATEDQLHAESYTVTSITFGIIRYRIKILNGTVSASTHKTQIRVGFGTYD